jgi:hypothetical protein
MNNKQIFKITYMTNWQYTSKEHAAHYQIDLK